MALCAYQSTSTTWRTVQDSPDNCSEDYRIITSLEYSEYVTLKGQVIEPVEEFDPAIGGAVFGAFFASVIVLFILGRSVGLILEAVKKW